MNRLKDLSGVLRLQKWIGVGALMALMVPMLGGSVDATAAQTESVLLPIVFRAVTAPPNIPPNIPQTKFGVQMYFDTGDNQDNPYYDSIVDTGASWIRCNIPWEAIEPTDRTPETYEWEMADRAVGANRDEGRYNMVITLEHAPAWFSGAYDGPPLSGRSMDDLAEFMAAVAERYDGDGYKDGWNHPVINHFELYNEPDHKQRWGNNGADYAQMLSVVAPAIKAANPNAQILLGGVAMDWFTDVQPGDAFVNPGDFVRSFVDDVLAAGGGPYIDIMNIHQYPAFRTQWSATGQSMGLIEKVNATRTLMAQYGINKPIMITESGTNSNNVPGQPATEETQARFVVELFTQAHAADVVAMMWFTMFDGSNINNGGLANGLVKEPVSNGELPYRKKSHTAYAVLASQLASAQFQRTLPAGETGDNLMEVHQFVNLATGKSHYVAWMNPIDSTAQVALTVAGAQATITGIYGDVIGTLADTADGVADGRVTVAVSGQPIYIQVD